jgi:uncharacterized membrane protein YbhN (UPF0104 family)
MKRIRSIAVIMILIITVLVFVRFFIQHPQYLTTLKHIKPLALLILLGLYGLTMVVLVFMYDCLLRLCGKSIPIKENILLTAYSTIANFFGPLQSGPGVRALYLKSRHQVKLRDYTLATLIYYSLFAFFSALFLFGGSRPWRQTIILVALVAAFSLLVIRCFMRRRSPSGEEPQLSLSFNVLGGLALATFIQVLLNAIIYFIELRLVSPHVSFRQATVYTGAANFALFVSLTPGAIGFRESFLIFARRLHRIGTATILAASIIDRAVYVLFLGILFLVILMLHAKDKLHIKQFNQQKT